MAEFVDELPGRPYQDVRSPHTNSGRKPEAQLLIGFAEALVQKPMKWARWPRPLTTRSAQATSSRVREGFYKSLRPSLGFEVAYRDGVVYVRHNPDRVSIDDRISAFEDGYRAGRKRGIEEFALIIEDTARSTQQGLRDAIEGLNT